MVHIAFQIPQIVWIYCPRILGLLNNPIGSPLSLYFSMIVTGFFYPGYNYIR